MKSNLLHILQAKSPHDDVMIYANREGLEALKTAIDLALLGIPKDDDNFFHSDGEGYGISIVLDENADCHNDEGEKFPLPYEYLKAPLHNPNKESLEKRIDENIEKRLKIWKFNSTYHKLLLFYDWSFFLISKFQNGFHFYQKWIEKFRTCYMCIYGFSAKKLHKNTQKPLTLLS